MIRSFSITLFLFYFLCRYSLAITEAETAAIREELLKIGLECFKDVPLNEQEIKDIKDKKINTDNLKCFVTCGLKKAGAFNDKGLLTPNGVIEPVKAILKEQTDYDNLVKFLDKCTSVNSASVDECERGKLTFDCLAEHASDFGYQMEFS